jgi:tetratricopeptide (TPR) repeat protein
MHNPLWASFDHLLWTGQYADAIAQQHRQIAQLPNTPHLYWQLGIADLLAGDVNAAQEHWLIGLTQMGLEDYDQAAQALVKVLDGYVLDGLEREQWQIAQRLYQARLELDDCGLQLDSVGDRPLLLSRLAHLEYQVGRYEAGFQASQAAIAINPQAHLFWLQADCGVALGREIEAIAILKAGLSRYPTDRMLWYRLGQRWEHQAQWAEAAEAYYQAVTLQVEPFAEAWAGLARVNVWQGKAVEAFAAFHQALRQKPDLAWIVGQEVWRSLPALRSRLELADPAWADPDLLRTFWNQADPFQQPLLFASLLESLSEQGRSHFLGYQAEQPGWQVLLPFLLRINAHLLQHQGQLTVAQHAYQQILAWVPDSAEIHLQQGFLASQLGDFQQAKASYQRALQLKPSLYGSYLDLARIHRFQSQADPLFIQVCQVEAELEQEPCSISKPHQISLHFALGKAYDDIGLWDRAFHHFMKGDRLNYSPTASAQHHQLVDATTEFVTQFFSVEFFQSLQGFGHESPADKQPIFIVGMPRSGSTLIEKILGSHPQVNAGGELVVLPQVFSNWYNDAQTKGFASVCSRDALQHYRMQYIDQAAQLFLSTQRWFTDKMLTNFFYVGFIHILFPTAPIIHCVRHPLDTCLSCFQQLFVEGVPWSYDLVELGRFYHRYIRLIQYWRTVLPQRMLDISYEDLVTDLESQAYRIVQHCRLDWDDACISFHKSSGQVETASLYQVRQPIYRSSIQKWRHYERYLQPLIDELGDAIHFT